MRGKKINIFGKQISVIYPIILAIMIGWLIVRQQLYQDKWDILASQNYNYQIEYPATWSGKVVKSGRGADYLHGRINDNYLFPRSNLLIHVQTAENPTFQDGTIWGEKIIQRDCGYICWEDLQTDRVGADDYLALTTTYQKTDSLGRPLYKEVAIIVGDEGMYMLQFSTYNPSQEIREIFGHMLESFEILEGEG